MIGYDDPCTQADLTVQKLYTTGLNFYFPGIKIIGEENVAEANKMVIDEKEIMKRVDSFVSKFQERLWSGKKKEVWESNIELNKLSIWVDPLDGTKEFTLGNVTYVTSLIGIAIDNIAEYGIIHKPFMDQDSGKSATYFGGKNLGVNMYFDSVLSEVPKVASKDTDITLLTTRNHYNKTIEHVISMLKPKKVIKMGGAGNKILGVIEGIADCYIYPSEGLKPWDICAGEAFIKEIGGCLCDCFGNSIDYTSPYILKGLAAARSKELLDKLVNELKSIPIFKDL